MNYIIVSLRGILAQTDSEDSVCALLNTFKCSRDHDREHFLWNLAIQFEKRCMSRTYLAVDVSDPSHILGYFSLGMKCLRLREDAPEGVHVGGAAVLLACHPGMHGEMGERKPVDDVDGFAPFVGRSHAEAYLH